MADPVILTVPDPRLRQVCEPCPGMSVDMVATMFYLMAKHGGVGLAAPQLGIMQRFFVMANGLCCVNPELTLGGVAVKSIEGCLSLPGRSYEVRRMSQVYLKTAFFGIQLDGIWAIVAQHEYDHLNGILIESFKDSNLN